MTENRDADLTLCSSQFITHSLLEKEKQKAKRLSVYKSIVGKYIETVVHAS